MLELPTDPRATIAERLVALRREIARREDSIATALVLVDQQRLTLAHLREEIESWELLGRWLSQEQH